jgi:hypothetical protein
MKPNSLKGVNVAKYNLIAFVFLILLTVCSASLSAEETEFNSEIIGVRQYMKNFEKHSNQNVTIEGIVSNIYKELNIFGLIDVKELKECKVVTCAQLTLPVRWNGDMPQIKSKVRVSGQARKEKKGFAFIANNLTIKESDPNVQ